MRIDVKSLLGNVQTLPASVDAKGTIWLRVAPSCRIKTPIDKDPTERAYGYMKDRTAIYVLTLAHDYSNATLYVRSNPDAPWVGVAYITRADLTDVIGTDPARVTHYAIAQALARNL